MDVWYWLTHQFSQDGAIQYGVWYALLEKPFFAPPPVTFGIAWGILYPLIALAFLLTIYLFYIKKSVSRTLLWVFVLHLFFNLSFTATALSFKNNLLSSIHILLVLGTLLFLLYKAWKESRLVFWLLTPYLAWAAFATLLQLSITVMN